MADYRQIAQDYAKEAIRTIILINGGAAVALLSQAKDLLDAGLAGDVRWAMVWWSGGVVAGMLAWVTAFASVRYVDKSERETALEADHLRISDRLMIGGVLLVLIGIGSFVVGCTILASGLGVER